MPFQRCNATSESVRVPSGAARHISPLMQKGAARSTRTSAPGPHVNKREQGRGIPCKSTVKRTGSRSAKSWDTRAVPYTRTAPHSQSSAFGRHVCCAAFEFDICRLSVNPAFMPPLRCAFRLSRYANSPGTNQSAVSSERRSKFHFRPGEPSGRGPSFRRGSPRTAGSLGFPSSRQMRSCLCTTMTATQFLSGLSIESITSISTGALIKSSLIPSSRIAPEVVGNPEGSESDGTRPNTSSPDSFTSTSNVP